MAGGSKYTTTVTNSTEEAVTVMVREVYQDPGQAGRLSFPLKVVESSQSYASHRIGDWRIRRDLEYQRALPREPIYTIVGGGETEVLSEESDDIDDEGENEE